MNLVINLVIFIFLGTLLFWLIRRLRSNAYLVLGLIQTWLPRTPNSFFRFAYTSTIENLLNLNRSLFWDATLAKINSGQMSLREIAFVFVPLPLAQALVLLFGAGYIASIGSLNAGSSISLSLWTLIGPEELNSWYWIFLVPSLIGGIFATGIGLVFGSIWSGTIWITWILLFISGTGFLHQFLFLGFSIGAFYGSEARGLDLLHSAPYIQGLFGLRSLCSLIAFLGAFYFFTPSLPLNLVVFHLADLCAVSICLHFSWKLLA